MKSYLTYFRIRIIASLQYRAAALAGLTTQLFFGFVFIMVYLAFYESNGTIVAPMKWQELVNYMWLSQAFFALTYPSQADHELLDMIKNGNIAYEILRPQNFYLRWYVKMIATKTTSTMLRFWPIIIIGLLLPYPYHLSAPIALSNFFLFIIALIFACLLISALIVLIHILSMFTIDSKGLLSIYGVIAEVFMGGTIPIPFFPIWLQKIAYALPFRYISDFPFRLYSGSIPLTDGYSLLLQSFIWIIVTIAIGLLITKLALRKAVIQGG